MEEKLSKRTIEQYLPVLKAIYASFEVQIKTYDSLDKKDRLQFFYMEKEFSVSQLLHAGNILHLWLEGSDFDCEKLYFLKSNTNARWIDFIKIFDKKLDEYRDDPNIIEISLSADGVISRQINGKEFSHDFKNDGLKTQIIILLTNSSNYTTTTEIQRVTKSKNIKSLSEAIRRINELTEQKIKLPKNKNLIISKRGSGYKINPLYNVITID